MNDLSADSSMGVCIDGTWGWGIGGNIREDGLSYDLTKSRVYMSYADRC